MVLSTYAQDSDQNCYEWMHFERNKSFTDTTFLGNGAMLYYQWNCDSTWLTFKKEEEVILKSYLDCDPFLCSSLGLTFIKEYPSYLLFIHNWSSGCCTPPDLVFIDKSTGHEKKRIGNWQFIWGDADEDYALYFTDTTYTDLVYLNHETDVEYPYPFESKKVRESLDNNGAMYLHDIFSNYDKKYNSFIFKFTTENGDSEKIVMNIK